MKAREIENQKEYVFYFNTNQLSSFQIWTPDRTY